MPTLEYFSISSQRSSLQPNPFLVNNPQQQDFIMCHKICRLCHCESLVFKLEAIFLVHFEIDDLSSHTTQYYSWSFHLQILNLIVIILLEKIRFLSPKIPVKTPYSSPAVLPAGSALLSCGPAVLPHRALAG